MKQALLIALALSAAAGSLFSPDTRADTVSLAFVINARPGLVPTARVRWSFALSLAPSATTKVTITEAGQLPVDAVLNGGAFVSLASGDRFRLDSSPTLTNGVSVLYEARGQFTGGNFCSLKTGALPLPRQVNLTYIGPAITQQAMGTYTVPGNTAATTFFCQKAQRRVSTAPAGITIGPPGLVGPPLRLPLDVIMVLDKSGSMGWELPASPINSLPSRWTVLGDSLEQFVALWEQASETQVTGDRLGLVHFDSVATPFDFGGGSMFKTRGEWDTWLTAAKSKTPGGATAIGAGINAARDKSAADQVNFDAVVILMTDGEQNVNPRIQKLGAGIDWLLAASTAPPASLPLAGFDELFVKGIPIQTIGFGTPATVEQDLLKGIAEQTAGTSIITATAAGLSAGMRDALVRALKGNTLGMLTRVNGTLTPPATVSAPIPLQIDVSVKRATLVLDWTGRRNMFDLLVQPPGGGTPFVPQVRKAGANWIVASIDVPADGPVGEWKALVRGNDVGSATDFRLSAYSVDSRLKYSLSFGRDPSGTGDPIPLMVDISYDGKPLTGIAGGIRLSPAAPAEGSGNILHAAGAGPAPVADQTATTAKVLQLARDGQLIPRTEPKPTGEQLVLADSGSGGDETAGDAIYTARVVDTRVPGRYRFDVALEWDDPRTGKVRRVESIERSVVAVPNPTKTVVVVAPPADGSYQVTVTPRDRFGNYVGPGYGGLVKVKLNGAGSVGPVSDPAQTGDYTVKVSGVPPGSTPTLDIQVDGSTVRDAQPLVPGTTGGAAGSSGKFAVWGGLGVAIPSGGFASTRDAGLAAMLGFEAALSPSMSVEATLGLHRFAGETGYVDVDVTQLGVNGKWYFTSQPLRFFATAGVGAYNFDPGSTRFGVAVGAGAQYQFTPNWGLEGRYTLHRVTNNSPQTTFSTLLLALRYAF